MKKLFVITLALILVIGISGMVLAAENVGDITQTGDKNEAEIEQDGHNTAAITQSGDKNDAEIEQEGTNFDTSSWRYGAYIEQTGDKNEADIFMPTSANGTRIQQVGDSNIASQIIGAKIHKSTDWNRMGLHIKQFGNNNDAFQETLSSFGCYGIQDMYIEQNGDGNFVDQYSIGGMQSLMEAYQIGDGNTSTQYQDARFSNLHLYINGDNNTTDQYQEYSVWAYSGNHDAYIDITGDRNDVYQTQFGEDDFLDVDIVGNRNYVKQKQTDNEENESDLNSASVTITGDKNKSDCSECNSYKYFNTHGYTQYQEGQGNIADITVNGDNNNFCQWQDGYTNEADITISGNKNTARQVQENDDNFATVYFNGDNNLACQYQDGEDSSIINVTGSGNEATVCQY